MEVTNLLLLSNTKSHNTSFACYFSVPLKDIKHVSIQYARLSENAFNVLVGTSNNSIAVNGDIVAMPCASYTRTHLVLELQRSFDRHYQNTGVSCQLDFGSSQCCIRLVSAAPFQMYTGDLSRHLGFNPDGTASKLTRTWDLVLDKHLTDASGNISYMTFFHAPHALQLVRAQVLVDKPGTISIRGRGGLELANYFISENAGVIELTPSFDLDACSIQFTPGREMTMPPRVRLTTEHFEISTTYALRKQYVLRCEQLEAHIYQGIQEMSGIGVFVQKSDGDIIFEPLIQPACFSCMIPKIDRLVFSLMDTFLQTSIEDTKVDIDILLKFTMQRKVHDRLAPINYLNPHIKPIYQFDHDLAREYEAEIGEHA